MLSPLPLLIFGPTASGKSALAMDLALEMAETRPSVIINGDSLQMYKDLSILTACPSASDSEVVPHRLYGVLDAYTPSSVGEWLRQVQALIQEAQKEGVRPIIVGGTGLYLKNLLTPLAYVPPIDRALELQGEQRQKEIGQAAFYEELKRLDPLMAERLKPQDRQRTLRAWCVLKGTGKSLAQWQQDSQGSGVDTQPKGHLICLNPLKEELIERARLRFLKMLEEGALEEVERVLSLYPWTMEPAPFKDKAPLQIALGFRPLASYLWHDVSLDEAIEQSVTATRQYIKRQYTWMRHQMPKPLFEVERLYERESRVVKEIKEALLLEQKG